MKKMLIVIGILVLLLISGCNTDDCVDSSAESILLIYEYSQEHTIRECFEYCKDICYKAVYGKGSWTDEYCAELCIPNN